MITSRCDAEFRDLERVLAGSGVAAAIGHVATAIRWQWTSSRIVRRARRSYRAFDALGGADRLRLRAVAAAAFALTLTALGSIVPVRAASAIPPQVWLIAVALAVAVYRWADLVDVAMRARRARRQNNAL